MDNRPVTWPHRLAALGLLLTTLAAGAWLIDQGWMARYQEYQAALEQQQSRLVQLERMAALRDPLQRQIDQRQRDPLVSSQYLTQPTPALAAADLQQRIKAVVEKAGGAVQSTQTLPPVDESHTTKVTVNVSMTLEMDGVRKVLHALEGQHPLLFIDNVQIQSREQRPRLANGRTATYTRIQLGVQCEVSGYLRKGTP